MKTLLLFGAIALSINAFSQIPTYVPTNGLVGWWPFNGNANDESVNTNDGAVNGATLTTDRFGAMDSAYLFNGAEWIDLIPNFDENERSISIWFSTSQNSATGQPVLNNDYPTLSYGHTLINIASNDGVNVAMGGLAGCILGTDSLNTWNHAVLTRDNLLSTFYFNGVQICELPNDNSASVAALYSYLKLGGSRNLDNFYFGKIDDTGIWNRALTHCEVQDLYDANLNSTSSVSQNGPLLSAYQNGAAYQWLDCDNSNATISGETNQTFTPAVTGNYSVEVTLNGCVDTSACMLVDFTGLNEINNSAIKVYPNPTKESFNIEVDPNVVGSHYFIYDQLGKVVQNGVINNPSQMINVAELSKGIYNLKIDNSDIHVKLIKE